MSIELFRRKRFLGWILLAISIVIFVSACGGAGAESADSAIPEDSAESEVDMQAEGLDEFIEAAADYFEAGDYEKAIIELEKIIELDPENMDAYSNLALSYFLNGDYENAVSAWTDVIEKDPAYDEAYFERGSSYFNIKEYDLAIADLTQAITLDAENADAYRIRGKSYGFLEKYAEGIDDLTQSIILDPASGEAYFNRAVMTSKIGSTKEDLKQIIADCAMTIQIAENQEILEQAQSMMQNLLQSSDDPELRQLAEDALAGKVAEADAPPVEAESTLMDIDINRPPGHSIGFSGSIEPDGSQRFLFLGSPGDTIGAGISSTSNLLIGIQATGDGEILGAVPSNDNSLFVNIPRNEFYHIIIEDPDGQGGDYVAAFEASPKVSFALNPNYFIIGRIPEEGILYYTFSGMSGDTLQGNVIPHPDTPIDVVVKILDLESQTVLSETNLSGAGENEQFTFTIPDNDEHKLWTFIVSVEDVERKSGAYILGIKFELASSGASTYTDPALVVEEIFKAAKSGDFTLLPGLCDPMGENDDDTQLICDIANHPADQESFTAYFKKGKINGQPEIRSDGTQAEAPFLFGPDGASEETMELINRNGYWYLFGF
ncbi:MAG: tetratricopeptide repeat protein [Anaerolineaceae bacterium]|nr:tetratricopeptide repeat protein [Anaerolineaceae bacterium]